jgi:hypothetical protein
LTILAASLKAYKFVTMPFARKTAPYRLFPDPVPAIGFSLPTFVVSSYAADPAFVPGSGVSSTVTTTFQVYDSVVDGAPAGVVIASLEIVDLFINVGAEDAGLIRLPGTQIVPNESTFCGKRSSRFVLAYGMATGSPISEHSYSGVASGAGWQASWFICGNITERIVNGAPWTGGIMGGIAITGTPTLSFTSPAEWHLYIPKIGPWGSTNEERVSTTLTGTLDNVSTQTFTSPVYVEPWGTTLQFTIELYVFVSVAVRGEVLQIPDKKLTRPSPDIRVQTLAEVMAFSMVQGHYTNSSELRVPTGAELKFSFYGVKADRTQSPPVMSYSNTINFYSWTQIFTTNGGFEPLIWDNGVFLLPTPTPTSQYNGAVEKVRCEGDQVVVESTLKSISNPAHLNPQPDPITQDMYYARNAIGGYHPETSIMGVTVAQFWEGGVPGGPIGTADQSTLTYDLP